MIIRSWVPQKEQKKKIETASSNADETREQKVVHYNHQGEMIVRTKTIKDLAKEMELHYDCLERRGKGGSNF